MDGHINESKKIYYVDYKKPESGLWDKIWGDDMPVIDLDEQEFQFKLTENDNATHLTIYDNEGNALSNETLNRFSKVAAKAFWISSRCFN